MFFIVPLISTLLLSVKLHGGHVAQWLSDIIMSIFVVQDPSQAYEEEEEATFSAQGTR